MDQIAAVPLGISAGSPTPTRHVSSMAVVMDGRVVLFDCGEGTQYQLMRAPFRWGRIEAIFISHLHGDHCYGLPGLFGSLTLHAHEQPLVVYGPAPIRRYLESVIETTRLHLTFPLSIIEIEEGEIAREPGWSVHARKLEHSVETFGYRLVEDDQPGGLNIDRARELGVPDGPLLGRLKRGEDVALDDGVVVHSAQVLGPPRAGRVFGYCLDTRPCENAVLLARGASLLVHEATYGEEHAEEARSRGHSTAAEAARTAARAGARQLLLTHFSPRYVDPGALLEQARAVFSPTDLGIELKRYPIRRRI